MGILVITMAFICGEFTGILIMSLMFMASSNSGFNKTTSDCHICKHLFNKCLDCKNGNLFERKLK